jgi:hypothetical protein
MKYKLHSLISVICLAIGITCFSIVNYFAGTVTQKKNLPNNEQRISLSLVSEENGRGFRFNQEDYAFFEGLTVEGMGSLVAASYPMDAEITAIGKDGLEQPFIIKYQCVSSSFFSYDDLQLCCGKISLDSPDEVIVSKTFAMKAFGKEDVVGMVIRLESPYEENPKSIRDYKIAGVANSEYIQKGGAVDCYFPLSMRPDEILFVGSSIEADTSIKDLNSRLAKITWGHGPVNVHASAFLQSDDNKSVTALLVRFLGALILLSGFINFLKFVIQMFYNRQRELVLRKCLGSDNKGLFYLLFSEIFWMMSVAFMFSLVVTELSVSIINNYIPREDKIYFDLAVIYGSQVCLYIFLLVVSIIIIFYPIYKLRKLDIVHRFVNIQKRHIFRNTMIGIQLAVSIFFVGGTWGTVYLFHEMFKESYSPLSSEEEKCVISMSVNTVCMQKNIDAILSDIGSLPEIIDRTSMSSVYDLGGFICMSYSQSGQQKGNVNMMQGDPHSFEFFNIPMDGKLVRKNEESMVYISEQFKEQLQKDGVEGCVTLGGREYQIAGVYRALYRESPKKDMCGSVFLVSSNPLTYYFKTSNSGVTEETIEKITEICRRYVPETLPLDIRDLTDAKQTKTGVIGMIQKVFILLAVVSMLLVMLSIYSAITMDTINRQKEVAIRKINGASPMTIALLFGKVYLFIYIPAFCIVFPLLKLLFNDIEVESGVQGMYSWDKMLFLFFIIAFMVFSIIAYKIYKVMYLNPSDILRKE